MRLAAHAWLVLALSAMAHAEPVKRVTPFPAYYPTVDAKTEAAEALEKALAHVEAEEYEAASELANRAIELVPTSATPHVLLGMIAEQQDRSEAAIAEYREALAWKPDESRAAAGLDRLEAPRYEDVVAVYEQQLVDLVNQSRAAEGLSTLKPHPVLAEVSRDHSTDMRDLSFFAHENPRPGKTHSLDRFKRWFDDRPWIMGENVSRRWTRPQPALNPQNILRSHIELMNSPGHRKNIMNPESVYVGVGIAINEFGDYWITEMFMKPRPEKRLPPNARMQ